MTAKINFVKKIDFFTGDETLNVIVEIQGDDNTYVEHGFSFDTKKASCDFEQFRQWINRVDQVINAGNGS